MQTSVICRWDNMEPSADLKPPGDQVDTEVPLTSDSEDCNSTETLSTAPPPQERSIHVLLTDEDLCIPFYECNCGCQKAL